LKLAGEIGLQEFKASRGWLWKFKKRNNFVNRRQTSSRSLTRNAGAIAERWIASVQQCIADRRIQPKNIINMDQVPRYFERASSSTLALRGSANIRLLKASTSHKRFTFSPTVNAEGHIINLDVLLSGLKYVPGDDKLTSGVSVNVNSNGMWSSEITKR
jgi:hypothetical protein